MRGSSRLALGGHANFTNGDGAFVPRLIRESGHHPEIADLLHTVIHTRRLAYRRALDRAIARHELDPGIDQELIIDLVVGPIWTRFLITREPIPNRASTTSSMPSSARSRHHPGPAPA